MHTAIHPAFQEKLAALAALIERSRTLRAEARAKIGAPRFQVSSQGHAWAVVDMTSGAVQGSAFSYHIALKFASAMEVEVTRKRDAQ